MNGMAEEWFVQVEEKEYGPVDLDTLREWKSEGRLVPQNSVRTAEQTEWKKAAEIPELFPEANASPGSTSDPELPYRQRSFAEVIAESCRLYGKGFLQFFALALLVGLPSLGFKLSLAYIHYGGAGEAVSATTRIASAVAVVMLVALLVSWPIFLAGLQFATAGLAAGRRVSVADTLRRSVNHWPRIARLSLFVYGNYIFWTLLSVLLILTLASVPSVWSILLAFLALAGQVYMTGRLFINFMFWQQTSTLGGLEGADALRESKDLARSRTEAPLLQRPLWRGAIIASIWLVILLVASATVEVPFMVARLQGIASFEQAYAMVVQLSQAPAPDAMTIATYVLSSLIHTALRPLLGIAFIVLYFDAKAGGRAL